MAHHGDPIPSLPPAIDLVETVPVLKALNRASRALATLKGQARSISFSIDQGYSSASIRTPFNSMIQAQAMFKGTGGQSKKWPSLRTYEDFVE